MLDLSKEKMAFHIEERQVCYDFLEALNQERARRMDSLDSILVSLDWYGNGFNVDADQM